MKRFNVRAGLKPAPTVFLFVVLVLTCFAGDAGAGSKPARSEPALTDIRPIIRFDREKVDLGKITRGEIAEHVFLVYNDGGAPLKILKLNPG